MASLKLNELQQDIDELKSFLKQSERNRVKDLLTVSLRKLENELISAKQENNCTAESKEAPKVVKVKTNTCYDTKITNYAWDQSDKFMKLYIDLKDVHTIPKENIKCEFTSKSMDLTVSGLSGKNYNLLITNLMKPIVADGSYVKVKTDTVLVMLKKESPKTWSQVTLQDQKPKEMKPPKMDEDPGAGLMDLMKQMYEDGDDDMKRTIAKAWTESRDKAASGGGFAM